MSKRCKYTASYSLDSPDSLDDHPFFGLELDSQQREFVNAIWSPDYDIIFTNSVAGTGKTTLAVGTAYLLTEYRIFDDIVYIVTSTQEKRIGYLPGTAEMKLAPYFMPLYDAAMAIGINPYSSTRIVTSELSDKEDALITCLTPIFLRGRNIPSVHGKKTVLIIDEAQNLTKSEMQTVLTRVNTGAKVIVIGHAGQCDLESAEDSGFMPFLELFKDCERCAVCELTNNYRGWISRKADTINSKTPA